MKTGRRRSSGGAVLAALFVAAALSRLGLLAWAHWQDSHWAVRYTDIDYDVITDGARAILRGGSPFDRATYRYTPLLAWIAVPNVVLHPAFAKVIFCCADLLAAWLYVVLLGRQGSSSQCTLWGLAIWLFSPFTAVISTRGSGESLVTCMLLGMLAALGSDRIAVAGALFGLAVHWRIYPIIYSLPVLRWLAARGGQTLISRRGVVFGLVSACAFLGLGALCLKMYGPRFLEEAYLYHGGRVDPRHNFSPYFLPAYLASEGGGVRDIGWVFSAVQVLLSAVLGWRWGPSDLAYALLLQTLAFVAFNKASGEGGWPESRLLGHGAAKAFRVSTAQYFTWYISLLPLALPRLAASANLRSVVCAAAICAACIAHWLAWAYALEFQGRSVHAAVWLAGILLLAAETWLLRTLMRSVPLEDGRNAARKAKQL